MAFAPARPTSRKPVHIVPAPKNLHGLGRVLENKIEEALEFDEIPIATMGLLFEVARERGGNEFDYVGKTAIAATVGQNMLLRKMT